MTDSTRIFTILDELIDGWCDRRAVNALRLMLPGYHSANGLADGCHQLYDALRDVRAMCKGELNNDDREKLNQAIVDIESILDNR